MEVGLLLIALISAVIFVSALFYDFYLFMQSLAGVPLEYIVLPAVPLVVSLGAALLLFLREMRVKRGAAVQ